MLSNTLENTLTTCKERGDVSQFKFSLEFMTRKHFTYEVPALTQPGKRLIRTIASLNKDN